LDQRTSVDADEATAHASRGRCGFVLWVAGLCITVLSACRPALRTAESAVTPATFFDPAMFDANRAYTQLVALVELGLRDSGTPGAERAAHHIRDQLVALGIETEVDVFTNTTPRGQTVFRNVIGRIPGRGEGLIIIGSHFDTKSGMPAGFQGANDSGSSTAVLLELARVIAASPPAPPTIWTAFFDGEECMAHYGPNDGLHGSRRLAQSLASAGQAPTVRGVIILDMIGDCDLSVTIPRNGSPELISLAFEAAREEGVRHLFSLFRNEIGDDHEPFLRLGMPAVDMIDFNYGSRPGLNDYWHTGKDRLEHVCADSLGIVGRVTLRMLNRLASAAPPAPTNRAEAKE
jgi:glutaminyl-peptide cyclotransferase